ncbi:MAG: hypothetical protein LBR16_03275 [Treponema sp.]|nr:hypothetical protein [Treponema sp.]
MRTVLQSYNRHNYRYKGMPKDAFHTACEGQITRIERALYVTGIHLTEKEVFKQCILNMGTAQAVYCERQQQTMGKAALPTA